MENKLTPEQIEDVRAREKEALETLKRLQLTPACQIVKENIGNDVFADRLYPFLQDTKYSGKGVVSPYTDKKENEPPQKA